MKQEKLARIVCHHCEREFQGTEDVYTISARQWVNNECDFKSLSIETTDEYSKELGRKLWVDREINFHKKCWENIAGPDYMP